MTIDNTPDDEVKDEFVNTNTGAITQVTEHPNDMILGEDEAASCPASRVDVVVRDGPFGFSLSSPQWKSEPSTPNHQ